jgi:hypothetical protein
MGTARRRRSERAGRGAIRSPGRPTAGRREHREAFWKAIARGMSSWDAAARRRPPSTGWHEVVRKNGGMPPASEAHRPREAAAVRSGTIRRHHCRRKRSDGRARRELERGITVAAKIGGGQRHGAQSKSRNG